MAGTDDRPVVRLARADWDTGWFQAEVLRQVLEELGVEVDDPADSTMPPATFYPRLAAGELDLWADGWFPLHEPYLQREQLTGRRVAEPISPVGVLVEGGGVQGYLADRATVDRLGISSVEDLARPEVAEAFDLDGDGRGDLLGCDAGWGCRRVIDEHLETFEWGRYVDHVVGDHSEHISLARDRLDDGESVLIYVWAPHGALEVLSVGDDTVWLDAPALDDHLDEVGDTAVRGCAAGPVCSLGWPVDDLRVVVGDAVLERHPELGKLLEVMTIPLDDIVEHNGRMIRTDGYDEVALAEDAAAWIETNRDEVDRWIAHATAD